MNMVWTDGQVSQLKHLWDEGFTCSQIAALFDCGLSRSAIIGKVHRLGLSSRKPTGPREQKPRQARTIDRQRIARLKKTVHDEPVCTLPPNQSECAIPFMDIGSGKCRWPLWQDSTPIFDRMCCAAPVAQRRGAFREMTDTAWCARHHRLAYRKVAA